MEREFARRFTLGLDAFYEVFFPREYKTPTGVENPLLLKLAPYVGDHYTLDPGDFAGLALQLEFVAWRGTARPSWLTAGDAGRAGKLPPILVLSATYKYTYVAQSDWSSQSAIWDWEKEKLWLPGHKNTLWFRAALNLFRFGIPLQLNVGYRNQSWLAGRNVRAADVLMVGMRVPAKFF
ncbi:MAG: hypothetical protein D6806_16900 [Deltaproteobacteria bacterium]|nr:MAG: hypothetical protein D6806_16900 [Deltaproteobacteria bacterium]